MSACGSTSIADVDAECVTDPSPATVGPVSVTCSLRTDEGEPIQGQTLNLEASMTHPGMRPELATMDEVDAGVYQADIEFTMAGDWYLLLTGETAEGEFIEETIYVTGVSGGR